MPNPPIRADGGALPADGQTRRAVLRLSGAAITVAAALVVAPAQAAAGEAAVDPALAAAAALESANRALADEPRDDDDIREPLYDEWERAIRTLARVVPTTPQGAAAAMRAMLVHESHCVDELSPFLGVVRNTLTFLERAGDSSAPQPVDGRALS
jgi:hypothetical protein